MENHPQYKLNLKYSAKMGKQWSEIKKCNKMNLSI